MQDKRSESLAIIWGTLSFLVSLGIPGFTKMGSGTVATFLWGGGVALALSASFAFLAKNEESWPRFLVVLIPFLLWAAVFLVWFLGIFDPKI